MDIAELKKKIQYLKQDTISDEKQYQKNLGSKYDMNSFAAGCASGVIEACDTITRIIDGEE